ncbi:MAG: RluA family pseudouridine synthase [Bacteroidetes bacterium]|nr:RluA family pseudouridine synthase [Bacteroidota bacterium]MCB9227369.1 RluA family pseudouridine synthase [Chitinophagales bacterium]
MFKKYQIQLLFEDENYVVVSKPSGLLSIPDRYDETLPNLREILKEIYGEIYTVHRLDKDTSGVICFAKNAEAHKYLNDKFAEGEVKKIYWAFTEGKPEIEEGRIDVPILNDMKNSGRMLVNNAGKEATTFFRLVENYGSISLMEYYPLTGRTHQIRVHSKYLGCPLLVDELYNGKTAFYLSEIKRRYNNRKFEEERPLVSRLTLHAVSIQFEDMKGKEIFVESELPKDLGALRKQLSKL